MVPPPSSHTEVPLYIYIISYRLPTSSLSSTRIYIAFIAKKLVLGNKPTDALLCD